MCIRDRFTDPDEYNVTVRLYGKKIEDQTGSGTSEKDSVVNKEQNRIDVYKRQHYCHGGEWLGSE